MRTVSIHESSDQHFDIPDTFKELLRYDSGKDDHGRNSLFGDPHMISVLEGSKFWLVDGTLGYLKTSTKFTPFLYNILSIAAGSGKFFAMVSGQFTQFHFTQCQYTQCHFTQPAILPNALLPNAILPNANLPNLPHC